MVDSQEFDTTYSNRIPYRSRWVHDLGDVNDLLDTSDVAATSDPTLTARFDRLLTWLSSAGEGRWETFVHACQSLEICENATAARSVFRRLTLLGHIEASPDGREWMVGPPVLVRLPCYRNRYCWCGQRTEGWLNRLRVFGEVEQQNQLGSLAPSRVTIEFSDAVRAKIAADAEGLRFEWQEQPLCDVLVDHLFDLKGWQRSLESINGLTDLHTVERWEGQIFVRDTSFFIRNGRYHGQSGLYRVTRGEGQRQSCLVFYFDEQEQRLLRGDWYGLRFLALRQAGHRCHATWQRRDGDHGTLLLPASERWPMIYEKALVLASGFLPHHLSGRNLLCYQDVPYRTAEVLASKLGVELQVQEAR
ncbi:MAG: hypothetical protein RMJ88_08790 [Thermogemmata sp.]|nr:hypothetical protein [Thermogemmata sp.]